jgi:hypothetical protein
MLELFIKHILETKSKFGSYSKSHKLNKLLEELIYLTDFKTDTAKYFEALQTITICTEQYRYNFMIDCLGYKHAVTIVDDFVNELLKFNKL